MRTGIHTKIYLPNIADDDLAEAVAVIRAGYDRSPKFSGWCLDALLDEQARRLLSHDGTPRETELFMLPATAWTARELVQGLVATTVMSYGVRSEAVGKFVDRLVKTFVAAIGSRLITAEDYIHAIEASVAEQNS